MPIACSILLAEFPLGALPQQPISLPSGPEIGALRIATLVVLFLAISGGSLLATIHRRGRVPPAFVALAHAALGATAFVLLVVDIARGAASTGPLAALACLTLTVLGAFVLFAMRLMAKKPPGRLIAVHAAFGLLAFLILLITTLGSSA
jgi:hypothetical protein